jgi:hypothetical protein
MTKESLTCQIKCNAYLTPLTVTSVRPTMTLYKPIIENEAINNLIEILEEKETTRTIDDKNKTKNVTFFYSHYLRVWLKYDSIPRQISFQSLCVPPPFQTYQHPRWRNWEDIWNTPPIELDPKYFQKPTLEIKFYSALFRIRITSAYRYALQPISISQGTTIVFKGYQDSYARHVVEWCQWIEKHHVYLTVVGVNSFGQPYPADDPDYPTFILKVPTCIANVPIPLPILPLIPFNKDKEAEDQKICWACN